MSKALALHYQDNGPDDTLPLVVLHGLFGSADNWRSHVKQWQEQRRVIAVDLRNHGRSPHASAMDYASMAEDVIALLDSLRIGRCDLLGHSMGGKVAISVARFAPERLASLVVADIAPVAYRHGHDSIFAAMRRVEEGRPGSRKEADSLMAEHVETPATRMFLATNLVRGEEGVMHWRVGLDEIENAYSDIVAEPAGEGAFGGPTLVLRGSRSDYVTDDLLPYLRQVLPKAEVVTLEAGHWLHSETPEAFQSAVNGFLAQRPS
ncbi:alpha/beta fold hydrolase [Modicisalibacter luteus]|uniref:Alpha/beta fold hydrolase n=1 Tax=Modicisalibacter luteus TaxID=453962 RepID=A0ABV7M6G4_9GAMM|nr:alpha/beta fold hydrolase [Halomonas lutea]GHA87059.1 alpha/beta hydrolase [Halomonas lutea]